jgi:hypothetical protein
MVKGDTGYALRERSYAVNQTTRRTALIAAAAALLPLSARGGKRKKRRWRRRRCPSRPPCPTPVAGDLRECYTPCTEPSECPDNAADCIHGHCRYCPSDAWELVINELNVFGGKVCVREGFSDLRAACEPW